MITDKGKGCWVQCTSCGEIYHIKERIPIDKVYIDCYCPKCEGRRALNCGDKEEDIYIYCDHTLDERYFQY